MSNIRKTKKCCIHGKTSLTRANIRYIEHPKNQKVLQTSENQLYQGEHPICQTSKKLKSAANMRKPASPGQTSDMSNIRKTKTWCKKAKTSLTRANIRYVEHPKNQKVLQSSKNQLVQGEHPICQHPKKQKVLQSSKNQLYHGKHPNVKHPKNQNVVQKSENQLNQGKHQICRTSEKPKSAAIIQKPAFPGQTSDMSNIRKTKKCCKQAKTSLTRANIRYVKYPKNQKVLQTCENQLYQGKHPICQRSEKPKSAANIRKPFYHGKHPTCQTSEKPKSAANIRKAAFPGQTSVMSNIRKTKKCCIHGKTSLTRANIRYIEHPKNQKVLQTSENQLYQGEHPICQTSKKLKSAANMRKPASPGQTSDMSNIRKTKTWCKKAKTSLTRANIRYVEHPKNQKVLQSSKNQLVQGEHPICQHPKKQKVLQSSKNQLYHGKHPNVKHPKNQKVLETSEKQIFQGKHPTCQTTKKPKSAANMRKPALPGQTSDLSNIRKTKKCCKHPKTSFTRANIRYVKHPKNQKVLQTSENQLYHAKHPICQTFEKPKGAGNIRKANFPGQTSDMSNIRKTKKCCNHAKTSFTGANIRYVKHPKNQKVLQTCENQLYQGKHPIRQASEKPKIAANIQKAAFPGQQSDKSNFRKTKKGCKHAKTSFTRTNIRYFNDPKNQKVLQLSENQLYHGKHPKCQTPEKPKSAANIRKAACPGQTSDMSNIRKNKKCCKHPKSSFFMANIRCVKHLKNQNCCKHPKTSFTMANIR